MDDETLLAMGASIGALQAESLELRDMVVALREAFDAHVQSNVMDFGALQNEVRTIIEDTGTHFGRVGELEIALADLRADLEEAADEVDEATEVAEAAAAVAVEAAAVATEEAAEAVDDTHAESVAEAVESEPHEPEDHEPERRDRRLIRLWGKN